MFTRPVSGWPICISYGQKGRRFRWSLSEDTGLWVARRNPEGQGNHRGYDILCPIGTPVVAMCDGFIIRARYENSLDHTVGAGLHILQLVSSLGYDSWVVKYAHLSKKFVEPGDQVSRYDPIAEAGDTGAVDATYLHIDLMDLKGQYKPMEFEP